MLLNQSVSVAGCGLHNMDFKVRKSNLVKIVFFFFSIFIHLKLQQITQKIDTNRIM